MKLLFVVHRYYPFPGGSENHVRAMAEEALRRGHDVTVLAGSNKGDQNGVKVTNDMDILKNYFNLIVIHGRNSTQRSVLEGIGDLVSPTLYLLIDPPISKAAMRDCSLLGWSTRYHFESIAKHNLLFKAVKIRCGIKQESVGKPGFKEKYKIKGRMFLSCGGYWPNKRMRELVEVFKRANLSDTTLVTTGYHNDKALIPEASETVMPLLLDSQKEVWSAMSEADCYIMHSNHEGFGLVLLESMLNKTPWIANNIAGATELQEYGNVYEDDNELISLLRAFNKLDFDLEKAYRYVLDNHTIVHTMNDIERGIKRGIKRGGLML